MDSEHDAGEFLRRRDLEQALHRRRQPRPKRMSKIVAQAFNRYADIAERNIRPAELKKQLASYVARRVHCPGFHRAEAEKAAGYVLEPGPNEPALPEQVLMKLLDELDAADAKGQIKPYVEGKGGGRGKWFVGVLKLRLGSYGIAQRKKGIRRS